MAAVTVLAIAGVAWLFIALTNFFLLIFASLVLAVVFDRMVQALRSRINMPQGLALTLAVLAFLGVFIGAFIMFGAQMASEIDKIRESVPAALAAIENLLARFGLGDPVRDAISQVTNNIAALISQTAGYALALTSGLANIVLVFVGAIFIAGNPAVYRRGLILLMPARAEKTTAAALNDAARGLRGWMLGQAVSSLVVAALSWAGLAALGVPASGGLALIAGLFDVIPLVGPIIAGVPAVLLAFTVSPLTALWTVALFLLAQQLQGNFLQPMIQKHAVNVPPAVLLFAVVAAGLLFGPLGILLSAPLTIVIFVIIQRVYVQTLLGKSIELDGEE